MSEITKLFLSLLGVTGAVGGGIGIYKMSEKGAEDKGKQKIFDRLKNSLLKTTEADDDAIWGERASTLSSAKQNEVVGDLWEIKGKSDVKSELKRWCGSKGNDEYIEDSIVVSNVKKYCTYNFKNKLPKAIDTQSGNWTSISDSLKNKGDNEPLSEEMKKVRSALKGAQSSGSGADADALKKWCTSAYEKMYEDSQDFKDASLYCVNNDTAG
ncbi:hypothetical protein HF1_05030 [Mycoplasma haemofelis str. Langford 1]|uniref:Uncharacterized protein n=1 Tax=Mycoplasma haemofelis (strain Langford 1) TaxID=941640 RepID=E8ZH90_MYCHL|nr:hypothetical protein [Mycoplasma haemofelis]CBY92511.1 hypothetical protein HF1_05030 [Mycoplasma haemofelis str. Langford 1]